MDFSLQTPIQLRFPTDDAQHIVQTTNICVVFLQQSNPCLQYLPH